MITCKASGPGLFSLGTGRRFCNLIVSSWPRFIIIGCLVRWRPLGFPKAVGRLLGVLLLLQRAAAVMMTVPRVNTTRRWGKNMLLPL